MDAADREINAHVMASPLIRPWWAASRLQREPNSLKEKKSFLPAQISLYQSGLWIFILVSLDLTLFEGTVRGPMVKKIGTILLISDV